MTHRLHPALAVLALCVATASHAATLGSAQLVTPLIPDAQHGTSIALTGLDPSRPVWVAYRVVGLSPTERLSGAVHFANSFDGVPIPMNDMMWRMDARDMRSGPTDNLRTQLQGLAAQRTDAQLAATLGPDMSTAYHAVLAGEGASADGRTVRMLPAPGRSDALLQVNVESAEGVQPVMVAVTAGQGDVPAEFADVTPGATNTLRFGKLLGVLVLGAGLLWWWRRRS